MHCPFCTNEDTQVKDSRQAEDGATIRRRRICGKCDSRFTTYERIQLRELTVIKKDGALKERTFLITGKLVGMSRAEVKSLIEENSGSIVSNVSKKLDFLIVGEKPTKRKVETAKDLKIKILSQNELIKMLKN